MRLVEVRLYDGPNVYRLEPAVKVEVVVGRRRTWYGQRLPGRHAAMRMGRPIPPGSAPASVRELAAWVRQLHQLSAEGDWIAGAPGASAVESSRTSHSRRKVPVTIHGSSEPGHWMVVFPWRRSGPAEQIAEGAFRLAERGLDPRAASSRGSSGRSSLSRTLGLIRNAERRPPMWITDEARLMPAVSISGTNGKSTTTRMITHILRLAGQRVGTTTSDGVYVDERLVEEGDLTGPAGARAVLTRSDLDVAVLETARGGIVLRGVGYQSNDVSVLTNVSSDHLDLHGLHTLPELAEVKAVVARMTRPEGTVVLNAEDPLVAAVAQRVDASVWFFSLDPRSPTVRRHLAAGRRAYLLDRQWLVEAQGQERTPILPAIEAPATMLGLARHNVANALAAAAAARALGASLDQVAAGLRDFQPSSEQAPGRLNLYRLDDRVVIVDFAHNEAGLTAVLDVAEGIARASDGGPRPLTAIVGTAGDRPDDALRGIGRIAAERADRLAIKETMRYLRGRTRESVIGEIMAGMVEGGARRADVPVYESESVALKAVLDDGFTGHGSHNGPDRGEVVVLLCHEDRELVWRVLREAGARPIDPSTDLQDLVPRLHPQPYPG